MQRFGSGAEHLDKIAHNIAVPTKSHCCWIFSEKSNFYSVFSDSMLELVGDAVVAVIRFAFFGMHLLTVFFNLHFIYCDAWVELFAMVVFAFLFSRYYIHLNLL